MKRIAIVGVGNRLMGDDGFGSYMAEALEGNVKGCDIIDLGATGVSAIDIIKDYDIIIIIDAVLSEKDFEVSKINAEIDSDEITSTVLDYEYSGSHGLGIQSVLTTLKIMGYNPAEVYLIGCKPYTLEPKLGLSQELESKLEQIIQAISDFLNREFGIQVDVNGVKKKLEKVTKDD